MQVRNPGVCGGVGLIDPCLKQGGKWDVNLGDVIISESVHLILEKLCGLQIRTKVPSLSKLTNTQFDALKKCDYVFVGGTNLISSNMNEYRQWEISLRDTFHLKDLIFLGVGWWKYQCKPNLYTRTLLNRVLDKKAYHSVRDSYTKDQLRSIGIDNVLNTSCPTAWCITPEMQADIPARKATDVIFTVTCYNRCPEHDQVILDLLLENYRNVYLWPQGDGDTRYAESLSGRMKYIPHRLDSFDQFLITHDDVDYVGTRLHAGIRTIQKGKRALIIGIDNRATEIGRDINLNVIDRSDVHAVEEWIHSECLTDIRLPMDEIKTWVRQFCG